VETGKASSELQLAGGARVSLGAGSRGRVYRDRLILERGAGELERSEGYPIVARSLRVQPAETGGKATVVLGEGNRVRVSAAGGGVRVTSGSGVLIASVAPGTALVFEPPEAGATAPTTVTGILKKQSGRFILQDETAGVTVELVGSGVEQVIGKRVEVTGTIDVTAKPTAGATAVVRVSAIKRVSDKKVAAAAGAGGGAAGGTAAGGGAGGGAAAGGAAAGAVATKAVIAGVVVAAAATGTAVGLTRSDEEKEPISQ